MTLLSFRVDPSEAERIREVAASLGVSRSEMIREALRRYLNTVATRPDADIYQVSPLTVEELSLAATERWAPAEDWSDWADAAR